jgi:hypothetical protein
MGRWISGGLSVLALLGGVALLWSDGAAEAKKRGNFPVRECDPSVPFSVIQPVLQAGADPNETEAFKAYMKWVIDDRVSNEKHLAMIKEKEWPNLREQAVNYMAHDKYGFKVWVLEMTPAEVTKTTRKVYFTLKNQVFPEDRQGLMIVERDSKGAWKLRSVTL